MPVLCTGLQQWFHTVEPGKRSWLIASSLTGLTLGATQPFLLDPLSSS
jgi:hypothetical protein